MSAKMCRECVMNSLHFFSYWRCFVKYRSEMLDVRQDKMQALNPLQYTHKAYLLEGLDDIIPQSLQNKIWDMIWQRWEYYENLCSQR